MTDDLPLFSTRTEAERERDRILRSMEQRHAGYYRLAFWAIQGIHWRREIVGEFIGEDLRVLAVPIIGPPAHANVWGGIVGAMSRAGVIVHTGATRKMKTKSSHGRRSLVYRWRE